MATQLIVAGKLTALIGKLAGVLLTATVQRRGLVVLVGIFGRDENCAASNVECEEWTDKRSGD